MWLCTKYGFYSIVQKGPDEFHVRARFKRDLVNLKKVASVTSKIFKTEPADYRYRIVVDKIGWQIIGTALVAAIDYPNFKAVIGSKEDQRDKYTAYAAFHHDLERMQNAPPYRKRKPRPVGDGLHVIHGDEDPDAEHRLRLGRLLPGIQEATD